MKFNKPLMCMLVAMIMLVSLFSGCGDSNSPAAATPSANVSTAPSSAPTEELLNPDGTVKLPLVDTLEDVSVWMTYSSTVYSSMNDLQFMKWLLEDTGVNLQFLHPSNTATSEAFTLFIASGDYTDVVVGANQYLGGGDKAIDDEVYLRLNDIVEGYMPNYQALRARGGEWEKGTISDQGNMWAIWGLTDTVEEPWTGLAIRSDYLGDLGIAIPETIDDWHSALTSLKNEKNVKYPLSMPTEGVYLNSEFLSAFGVGKSFYNDNGTVKYGLVDPAAKGYVELMRTWYSEGLIDTDFLSRATAIPVTYQADTTLLANGETVAGPFLWGFAGNNLYQRGMSQDANIYFTGVKAPVLNKGDKTNFGFVSHVTKTAFAITTQAKNPTLICRLFDYLFSKEGSLFMNYGREGDSYEFTADGKIKMTDKFNDEVKNSTFSNPWEENLRNYTWWDGPGLVDYTRIRLQYTDDSVLRDTSFIWAEMDTSKEMPAVTLTAEEGTEYSGIMGDIQTYIQECLIKMITSVEPMDLFDTMIAQIQSMNIDRAVELQQAVLDRYNAR